MSLHRFFLDEQILSAESQEAFLLRLSVQDLKHFKVLRLKPEEHIAVIDASSDYFDCEIIDVRPDGPIVRIAAHKDAVCKPYRVVLFQGLPKSDKMETIIRHGTEVGIDRFCPVEFARCVVRLDEAKGKKKRERWQAIAKSAAMQAGRRVVPTVDVPCRLADVCQLLSGFDAAILFWEEASAHNAGGSLNVREALAGCIDKIAQGSGGAVDVAVVIGPEGGLERGEVERMLASNPGCALVSLGDTILRTETAGIVGSALVIYELGGLGGVTA